MIKATIDVRPSTPNSIVLIESGLLPIKAILLVRLVAVHVNLGENHHP